MNLFDVYSLWNIEPVRAKGCRVWDRDGVEYLDFYGGHAVISIGHSHPVYVKAIQDQAVKIGFYSNSVINSLQTELAEKLGEQSGYPDYSLFLCNSGAEANENALKLASFHTGKKRIIAFSGSFHGRTSGAVAITDNPSIQSPFNTGHEVTFVPLNDTDKILRELEKGDVAAVIAEGIQGVAGIFVPENGFMQQLERPAINIVWFLFSMKFNRDTAVQDVFLRISMPVSDPTSSPWRKEWVTAFRSEAC